ncbi:YihY/virulence factor BrkB family protein [Novosphingobium sp.]|uniref:YihY/virulence factor BrkB family protein n=1 Tax=Novosphingobium sp. TaxID=1874826 RepID=UPI0038BB8D6D
MPALPGDEAAPGGRQAGDITSPLIPDLSPEARRRDALRKVRRDSQSSGQTIGRTTAQTIKRARIREVLHRVWTGVVNDGTIHAGNFAYMVLVSLFPFFITGAALFSLLGEARQRSAAVDAVLRAMPPDVANVLQPVAQGVITARSGWLLWIGGLVGLWTVSSLVETIRDVLRRAYGTRWTRGFWFHRLTSTGLIIAAVVALLLAITAQVALSAAQEALLALAPELTGWITMLARSQLVPLVVLYGALWVLFISLTPSAYRGSRYPKWPGALFVTGWWLAVTTALPKLLRHLFTYDLTYGSLAGVMIALFFFWLVGLGMVVGAELNAALAETPEERDTLGQADDRAFLNDGKSASARRAGQIAEEVRQEDA